MILNVSRPFDRRHQSIEYFRHLLNHTGEQPHVRGVFLDAVPYHGAGESFNKINYVIQSGHQGMNVFAINRRDE